MRAHLSLGFYFLLAINAWAQIVFELPSAIPGNGEELLLQWEGNSSSLILSGTDVVWDLTGQVSPAAGSMQWIMTEPSNTQFADSFPSATHAHGYLLNGDTIWDYYRLSGDSLWHVGADLGSLLECTVPRLYMTFPYAMGDLAVNTSACTYEGAPIATMLGLQPVASGTIIYDNGTIPDVVLLEQVQDGEPNGYYVWMRQDNAITAVGTYHDFQLELFVPTVTGLAEVAVGEGARIWPSPASDRIMLSIGASSATVRYMVYDSRARLIHVGTASPSGGSLSLDVSALEPGQYHVRVDVEGVIRHARICVAR